MPNDNPLGSKESMKQKTRKLGEVTARVQQFVADGGDLKSKEAVPLSIELWKAFDALAQEFGHKILMPIDKTKGNA